MAGVRCSLLVVSLLLAVAASSLRGTSAAAPSSVQQLGNSNIDHLLRDPSYVMKQIRCVLDKGQCDRLGGQLKLAIPEVINNNCARCTPQQAANARKLINFIESKYPGVYQETLAKYRGQKG